MNLFAHIDSWAQVAPDRIAHRSGARTLTYGELARRSDALAAHIATTLPDDQSPVAVVGHKEPEMLVGFLGAAKARHPYIPLDDALPEQRIARIIEVSGAALVLTPKHIAELSAGTQRPPSYEHAASDPYYIMFTSGSTGEPKGVVITLGNLVSFLEWMLVEQELTTPGDVFLSQVPFSFDVSVMDLYFSLVTSGTMVSVTRDDIANPPQLYRTLANANLSVWVSTPSFARLCLMDRSFNQTMLPQITRFIFCGETLAPEIAAQLLDRFPRAAVWNTYGPTEATVATTSVQITRAMIARYPALPIGRPMPGTAMPLLNGDLQPVADDARGEIIISGPNVSPGYLHRADLTERAFFTRDGVWSYRTGDIGHTQDGLLFFDGRRDNQVKLHGYRIELGDVESHLQALPDVRDAVVLVKERNGQPDALAAFVILNDERTATTPRQLSEQLTAHIPRYMVPRTFRILDTFPMTVNGKADRRKLAELLV